MSKNVQNDAEYQELHLLAYSIMENMIDEKRNELLADLGDCEAVRNGIREALESFND